MIGLYLHIPFCAARCHYCDFVTFTGIEDKIDAYLRALSKEASLHRGRSIKTLFIGGGTPSVLSPNQIDFLFDAVHENFDATFLTEATVEVNPESAAEEKLRAFQRGGVNRLSIGFQTADEHLLKKLGRLHDKKKFLETYALARGLGFNNINIDLMFGLPDQTLSSWTETLEEVVSLKPEHVSTYALKVESGTHLSKDRFEVDQDLEADMYLEASHLLSSHGYDHYEISNFAKPGFESRHNLLYWKNEPTLGLGVGAASFIGGRRRKNTSQLSAYMESCLDGKVPPSEESALHPAELERENVMLKLRLKEGVEESFLRKMKIPLVDQFLKAGLAASRNGSYSLTPQGWLLSNQLFQELV